MTVQTDLRIKVRSEAGEIESLTPDAFHQQFGVRYATRLRFADEIQPIPEFRLRELVDGEADQSQRADLQRQFGLKLAESLFGFEPDQARWLYSEKLRNGETADLYIAKVSEKIGYGIFAGCDIEPGDLIGDYTGLARQRRDDDDQNLYLFGYTGGNVIDARDQGNYTRFINHSQKRRNCHYVQTIINDARHVFLVAIAPIAKGEQVLFDYGAGYWKHRGEPAEFE